MLRLYRILGDNRIFLAVLARAIGSGRSALNHWLREEARVNSIARLKIETTLKRAGIRWTGSLWDSEPDFVHPFFESEARSLGRSGRDAGSGGVEPLGGFGADSRAPLAGPLQFREEAPMATKLSQDVLEFFGLERDPFLNEMQSRDDVFMSKGHARVERTLFDAASCQYFIALVADVGSGKTTLLKKVLIRLAQDRSFHVSRLRCIEKEDANAYGIMEALIRDFTADPVDQAGRPGVAVRHSREARARQIGKILDQMVREKQKPVLIIDDAHALGSRVLRSLKRLYDETECGFRRSISIILAGQSGNHDRSQNLEDKINNFDLREVSERCQLVELKGLGGELGAYVAFKLERAGSTKELVTADALKLLGKSYDTPLAVNNVLAVAMTLAHEVGKKPINAELMSDAMKLARGVRRPEEAP